MGFDRLEWQKVTHSTRVCNMKAACTQRHFCCRCMMQVRKHPWVPTDSLTKGSFVTQKTKTSIFVAVTEKAPQGGSDEEQATGRNEKGGGGSCEMADCSCREYGGSWRGLSP